MRASLKSLAKRSKEIAGKGVRRAIQALPPQQALKWSGLSLSRTQEPVPGETVFHEETYTNPPPLFLDGQAPTLPPLEYAAPAARVHRIVGGYVSSLSGVHTSSGHQIAELSGLTPHLISELRAGRYPCRVPDLQDLSGTTLTLSIGQQWNYFHWLLEVIGRLAVAEKSGAAWDRVYVEASRRFQTESLALLLPASAGIIDAARVPLAHCEQLLAVDCPDAFQQPTAWIVDYLRRRFFPWRETGNPLRLYVSRDRSSFRRTTNEAAVAGLLTARGFTIISPENLPLAEQVSLFSNAKVVVGTHGAGLTNIVFCRPGSAVLELMPPRYCHWMYYNLACRADLRYACVLGEGVPDADPWAHQKEDLSVDLRRLASALDSLGIPA